MLWISKYRPSRRVTSHVWRFRGQYWLPQSLNGPSPLSDRSCVSNKEEETDVFLAQLLSEVYLYLEVKPDKNVIPNYSVDLLL